MSAALTAIEPYQPLPGIPMRDSLARAHEHIGRTEKFVERTQKAAAKILEKHEALQGVVHRVGANYQKLGVSALHALGAGAIGGAIGVADGRWGGERGYASKWGVPLDLTVAVLGHGAALATFAFSDGHETLQGVLHSVGNAGLASGTHRFGHELGVAWAQKSGEATSPTAAAASPNGVKGGTVYTVAHPTK